MKQNNKPMELSYYRLTLLSYLKESHPELASDTAFIKSRADEAAEAYSNAIKEGFPHTAAAELATAVLHKGLYFSPHDTIVTILWNEFDRFIPLSEAKDYARRILPGCRNIFGNYSLSDEFMYSPEYDKLYTELVGFIDIWLEENECFEQREQSQIYLSYAESGELTIEERRRLKHLS